MSSLDLDAKLLLPKGYVDSHRRPNGDRVKLRKGQVQVGVYLCILATENSFAPQDTIDAAVQAWVRQTNDLFGYLSEGQFGLKLAGVDEPKVTVPEDYFFFEERYAFARSIIPKPLTREGFEIMVLPAEVLRVLETSASYVGKGVIFLDPTKCALGEDDFPHWGYDLTSMREIGHGLIGFDHCDSVDCLMEKGKEYVLGVEDLPRRDVLRLCKEDRETLGWPYKKPLRFWP